MQEILKVTFPDGEEICYRYAKYTMLEVLRKIGVEQLSKIDMTTRYRPLVSTQIYPELKDCTLEILPGWYYISQSDTREKTSQLININRQLGLGLKIEVGDFAGKRMREKNTRRPKHKIRVTFADGQVIDYDSFLEVFKAAIDKLGVQRVKSRANIDLPGGRSLFAVTNREGNRFEFEQFAFMALPPTAVDAAKQLKFIATKLREPINVELIKPHKQHD